MQINLDHVTVCGADLGPVREEFAMAGLATGYGGPHANGGTHMALLGFDDGSYLELIAPLKPGNLQSSPWAKFMLGNAGAGAWAIGTTDIQSEVARLTALGIETAGPQPGSRQRPDGKALKWQTASLGPGSPGAMLPFMIQDDTPRQWRAQPTASVMGSGFTGIAAVVLGVTDLDSVTRLFRRAYGWDAPRTEDNPQFGAKLAHFSGTPVILAEPLGENSWLARRIAAFGEIPAAFLLKTDDLTQAMNRFDLIGETQWFGSALAWFDAAKLHGVRLGVLQP